MTWSWCELRMHVWNVLHAARWKYETQKSRKKSPSAHHCTTFWAISLQLRHVSTIGKKLVKQQYVLHISSQYGELRPTNGWDRLTNQSIINIRLLRHDKKQANNVKRRNANNIQTKHRASTSMYSLTFYVRVMPERHQWKPAVQAAAVMLRRLPVDGQSPASQQRPLPIYGAQFWERRRHSPVTGQQRAQTSPSVRTMSSYRGMDASL